MSLRKLRYHEGKLLKKVDFLQWSGKGGDNIRENEILSRYRISRREDYVKYNRIVGTITKLAHRLKKLEPGDPFRIRITQLMLDKLHTLGLLKSKKSLSQCENINASAFCARRLPVVMCRLKMAQHLKGAITMVEQGHVRVGTEVVTDPAFIVARTLEDFVTWVDSSKIKAQIEKYHDKLDDFTLLGN